MSKATLIKSCASDLDVVNAARVSFNRRHETITEADKFLIGYLLRNRHTSPFEHGYFQFHVAAPIFVQRDWMRHRIGSSFNEISTRYVEMPFEVYEPELLREQLGKPGDYTFQDFDPKGTSLKERFEHARNRRSLIRAQKQSFKRYQKLLRDGVCREQAMAALPMGTETQFYWSCNPRSLMHFLSLRNAPDARQEIRVLAQQIEDEFAQIMPTTYMYFIKNDRKAP